MDNYKLHHYAALQNPQGPELTYICVTKSIASYAEHYRERFDSDVAADGVLGDGIAHILRGAEILLNGDLGRLDGGMCWQALETLAKECGWKSLEDATNEV